MAPPHPKSPVLALGSVIVLALSLGAAGCGARSGLSDDLDAGTRDGRVGTRDAGRADGSRRDAGVVAVVDAGDGTCPARPTLGFRFVPRTIELPVTPRTVSLTTLDGVAVLAAVEESAGELRVTVRRIDALGDAEPVLLADFGAGDGAVIGSGDGMLAVAYETVGGWLRFVVLRADGTVEWSADEVPPLAIGRIERPLHNGATWLVGFTNPYASFGTVDRDGFTESLMFGPVEDRFGVAVDPESGRTFLLYRVRKDGLLRLLALDRDGGLLDPTRGARIDGYGWEGVPSLGWTASLGAWPLVVGGFSRDDEGARMRLHRYDVGGLPGPGFSSPARPNEHRWASTTLPPPGHATGYGLVGAERRDGGWQLWFHGSGEDFVGDSQEIGTSAPSERFAVDITTNACGYLIGWIDGSASLHVVTAIPR